MKLNLEKALAAYREKHPESKKDIGDLVDALGVSHTTLYNWRKGLGVNTLVTLQQLINETGLTFEELFDHGK